MRLLLISFASVLAAVSTSPAETWRDRLDPSATPTWEEPSPEVVLDARTQEARPSRAGEPAHLVFGWRATNGPRRLSVHYTVRLSGPGDAVRCEASWDGEHWLSIAETTWQRGPQTVVLDRWLDWGDACRVRLSLRAANDPRGVGLSALSWVAAGLTRTLPPPGLTRGAWLYPAWAAQTLWRVAPGLPPGRWATAGAGRIVCALAPALAGGDGAWQAASWTIPAPRAGRTRLLVAPTGEGGGSLTLDGCTLAAHDLAGMPLGVALPASPGPLPPLALTGVPDPDAVRLVVAGPLEIRHLRPRWSGGLLWLDATVINHGQRDLVGNLRASASAATGDPVAWAVGGYRFPPGGWLAPLALACPPRRWEAGRPACWTVRVQVDDGQQVSDAAVLPVALKEVRSTADGWVLNGALLRPAAERGDALATVAAARVGEVVTLPPPVAAAALALAAERGVPLAIQAADNPAARTAAELLHGGHPAVLGVVAPPGAEP